MECLVVRDDKTLAYIHKIHNYNPKGTPRPKFTLSEKSANIKRQVQQISKEESSKQLSDKELLNILQYFL